MTEHKGQRGSVSLSISGEANYRIQGTLGPPVTVTFNEISTLGIRFVTTERLPQGTMLELSIRVTSVSDPIEAIGIILWQRRIVSKFLSTTSVKFTVLQERYKGRLLQYIQEYSSWKVIDREQVRCPLFAEVACVSRDKEHAAFTCMSSDIGLKGMRLLTDAALDVGKNLHLSLVISELQGAFDCDAQVVWRRSGTNACIGVSFVGLTKDDEDRIRTYMSEKLLGK